MRSSWIPTAAGRGFCSGGDVEDIIGALFDKDYEGLLDFTRLTCDLVLSIRQCRRPVVAALNGTVAGAGAVIATACDFRIAAPSAKIAFLFTKVGLSGADMGASWLTVALTYWHWLFESGSHMLLASRVEDLVDKTGDPDSLFWKVSNWKRLKR